MQFLTSLFGGSENTVVTAILALGIVLLLIVASVWVLKFVFRATSTKSAWGHNRLALVDRVNIDAKRQLVIVRRDDVEHLIMTGGPQDVVIESGIAVEKPAPRRAVVAAAVPAGAHLGAAGENPFLNGGVSGPMPMEPPIRNAIERLRDFTRPLNQRSGSLRHTGLMRTASKMEVIGGKVRDHHAADSGKTPVTVDKGQTRVGEAALPRDEAKAGGH